MRTERLLLLLLLLCAAGAGPDAAGQALYDVDASTQVRFIRFALSDSAVFTEGELLKQILLTGQGGLRGLRGALEFIPLVTPVGVQFPRFFGHTEKHYIHDRRCPCEHDGSMTSSSSVTL